MADEEQQEQPYSEIDQKLEILKGLDLESLKLVKDLKISKEDLHRLRAAKAHVSGVNLEELRRAAEAFRIAKPKLDELVESAALLPQPDEARKYMRLIRALSQINLPDLEKLEQLTSDYDRLSLELASAVEKLSAVKKTAESLEGEAKGLNSLPINSKNMVRDLEEIVENRLQFKGFGDQRVLLSSDYLLSDGVIISIRGPNEIYLVMGDTLREVEHSPEGVYKFKAQGGNFRNLAERFQKPLVEAVRDYNSIKGKYKAPVAQVVHPSRSDGIARALDEALGLVDDEDKEKEEPEHWAETVHAEAYDASAAAQPQHSIHERLETLKKDIETYGAKDAAAQQQVPPPSMDDETIDKLVESAEQVAGKPRAADPSSESPENKSGKYTTFRYDAVAQTSSANTISRIGKVEYKGLLRKKFYITEDTDGTERKVIAKLVKDNEVMGIYQMRDLRSDKPLFHYKLIDEKGRDVILKRQEDIELINLLYMKTQVIFD
jgi:hypothetical protein